MEFNFNVKVKGGPRTQPEAFCYYTAVNKKEMRFANGETTTNEIIAFWIAQELTRALRKVAAKASAVDKGRPTGPR